MSLQQIIHDTRMQKRLQVMLPTNFQLNLRWLPWDRQRAKRKCLGARIIMLLRSRDEMPLLHLLRRKACPGTLHMPKRSILLSIDIFSRAILKPLSIHSQIYFLNKIKYCIIHPFPRADQLIVANQSYQALDVRSLREKVHRLHGYQRVATSVEHSLDIHSLRPGKA